MNRHQQAQTDYWQKNIRMVLLLLVVWALPSFGAGIIFVEYFNRFQIAGFPLGFWFAQQGSIYVFIVLIFIYARFMDRLDAAYARDDIAADEADAREARG